MILISACLLGIKCRYDGASRCVKRLKESSSRSEFVPVCPEQLGGLSTPREPATLVGGDGEAAINKKARVITSSGKDVTDSFLAGVEAVLQITAIIGADKAVLKEKSPSCGVHHTYIDGALQPGRGVLAAALAMAEIPLFTENDFEA